MYMIQRTSEKGSPHVHVTFVTKTGADYLFTKPSEMTESGRKEMLFLQVIGFGSIR